MAVMLYGLMEFPEKLRWLMKEHRYSQEGLGKKLDVSQGLVGNWCRGKNVPGLELAVALAREFDVSMDFLFDNVYDATSGEAIRSDREIRRIIREIGPERAWKRLVRGAEGDVEANKPYSPPVVRTGQAALEANDENRPYLEAPVVRKTTPKRSGSSRKKA